MKYLLCSALSLVLLVSANVAQAQAPISVSPKTVQAGTSPTLTVSTNGFFDLSAVTAEQIDITPRSGVTNLRVSNASARSLSASFTLASNATLGPRSLVIRAHGVTVSLDLLVGRAPRDPDVCTPQNCRPPRFECQDNICVRVIACVPRCRPPRVCEFGRCVLPQ
jgi:hypothetical protein